MALNQRGECNQAQEPKMAVMKVIELMAESSKSWEDATQSAVLKAGKTLKGIKSVWVQDQSASVDNKGRITAYRVTCKVTFEVGGKAD
jgi:dodecin